MAKKLEQSEIELERNCQKLINVMRACKISEADKVKRDCFSVLELFYNKKTIDEKRAICEKLVEEGFSKPLVDWYDLLEKNLQDKNAKLCFEKVNRIVIEFSSSSYGFGVAVFKAGLTDIVLKVLERFKESYKKDRFEERSILDLIAILMHLATVASIRDGMQEKYIENKSLFQFFKDPTQHTKTISLLTLSAISRIADASNENEIKADNSMLDYLQELARCAISSKDKTVKRNEIELSLENILFTIELLAYNAENSTYMVKKKMGPIIYKALQINSQLKREAETKCCLSTLMIFLELVNELDEGEVVLGCPGLTDFLVDLKSQGQSYDITELIEEILGSIKSSCDYVYECREFFNSLNIPEEYLDETHNECYCSVCHKSRKQPDFYERGEPPKFYSLPIGWYRFGLKVPAKTIAQKAFDKWHRAFHGTQTERIVKILQHGDLLMPGDTTAEGNQLRELDNHYNDKTKPKGFNTKQVFVSPTVKYAGLDTYAKPYKWKSNGKMARVAFQVLIQPDSYNVGKETVGISSRLDSKYTNNELEWSTDRRGVVILYGILVKVEKKK